MAKQMWVSEDGRAFNTEQQAKDWDTASKITKYIRDKLLSLGMPGHRVNHAVAQILKDPYITIIITKDEYHE